MTMMTKSEDLLSSLKPQTNDKNKKAFDDNDDEDDNHHQHHDINIDNKNDLDDNNNNKIYILILYLFMIVSCMKILLFSSYHSTDFDVHRHWMALTRHLPFVGDWYYDDIYVQTIHTLDYPPSFAFFEYVLSNNWITQFLLTHSIVDDRCLQLLNDEDKYPTSNACVIFLRSTVVVMDIVLWYGTYKLSSSISDIVVYNNNNSSNDVVMMRQRKKRYNRYFWTIFFLIVCHPGLLWLDHIHFQYNGMLLGLLMISISYIIQSQLSLPTQMRQQSQQDHQSSSKHYYYLLLSALFFAFLLTMKHLYLTLSLWYFAYLLRSFCFDIRNSNNNNNNNNSSTDESHNNNKKKNQIVFSWRRFIQLALVAGITIIVPFIPFLISSFNNTNTGPINMIRQIMSRLFPFQRGLVHDYWAGNIWAVYMFMRMILLSFGTKVFGSISERDIQNLMPDDIQPKFVAILLLIALLFGAYYAWNAAALGSTPLTTSSVASKEQQQHCRQQIITCNSLKLILLSLAYTVMSSFQLAYHVHEKAIMTIFIFLIPLAVCFGNNEEDNNNGNDTPEREQNKSGVITTTISSTQPSSSSLLLSHQYKLLLWEVSAWGILGISPLLFEPREIPLKWTTYITYVATLTYLLFHNNIMDDNDEGEGEDDDYNNDNSQKTANSNVKTKINRNWFWWWDLYRYVSSLAVMTIMIIIDVIPISLWGRYEFAPLALTSVACATGLLIAFVRLTYCMVIVAT